MKSGLGPLDGMFEAIGALALRLIVLGGCVALGAYLGSCAGHGRLVSWSTAVTPFAWAAAAWVASPSYLVVEIVTLLVVVHQLRSDFEARIWPGAVVVLLAWAWLAYIWV